MAPGTDDIVPEAVPPAADVCVVGGGLAGLWTALHVKRLDPSAVVVLLEAGICGGAASGRNGGFVMTAWSKFGSLVKRCGVEDAVRYGLAAEAAVEGTARFCEEHGVDAQLRREGWLWAATNEAQAGAWEATLEALAAAGQHPFAPLTREQVARRSGSVAHVAGVFEAKAATVHPGLLVRGLRDVAIREGVVVLERTAVTAVEGPGPTLVRSARGTVRCERVVLAISAWASALPALRGSLITVASDVVATPPIGERLARLGLAPGTAISDSRRLVHYYRTTEDGRLVFGKGGGALARGGRIGSAFDHSATRAGEAHAHMARTYPALADVAVPTHWRGAVDYSVSGLPVIGALPGRPDVLVATGFSGNGVGPSHLAGEALARIAVQGAQDLVPEALTAPFGRLPPEPLRSLGGRVVRAAVARKERAEDDGARPPRAAAAVATLDPTSFVDRGAVPAPVRAAT